MPDEKQRQGQKQQERKDERSGQRQGQGQQPEEKEVRRPEREMQEPESVAAMLMPRP